MVELSSCALVLLAGGSSQRMGRPKQLLSIGNRPLLRRAAEACVESGIGTIIVVLGARALEIGPVLDGLPVNIRVNDGWEEGMASSIRAGLEEVSLLAPAAQGLVIALADQPKFSSRHVTQLIVAHRETGRSMVASRSAAGFFPPAFFCPKHFPALRNLRGDAGARALLLAYPEDVAVVETGELGDLDTPEDYLDYLKRSSP